MKLIESKAEYIPQEEGLEGIYKMIELAGRTAYHSLDKITPTSAKNFVDRMIKSKHGACLEHGTVYLKLPFSNLSVGATNTPREKAQKLLNKYIDNKYTQVFVPDLYGDWLYATSNMRVLVENNWLDDLKYLCPPTESHEKRYTMRFTCSRAIAQELTRHRVFSFLMSSQRYINYYKEKHKEELSFIKPSWLQFDGEITMNNELCFLSGQYDRNNTVNRFLASLIESKYAYLASIKNGLQPQQARDVLPNATKTELIMTGFSSDWKFLMDLRLFGKTGVPHPDMLDLMQKAHKAMQEAGIWEDIMSKPSKFE